MVFTMVPSMLARPVVSTREPRQYCSRSWLASSVLMAAMVSVAGCPAIPDDSWTLEALEAEENPANLLSRTVRWTTSTPASSHVEFGADGVLTHRIGDDTRVTEHEVVVFGLWAETEYTFEAVSVDGNGDEARGTVDAVVTDALPFECPVFEVNALDPDAMQPGWTMTNVMVDGILSPPVVVMLDPDGRVVWYHQVGEVPAFADVDATLLDDGTVLIGGGLGPGQSAMRIDMAGNRVWQGPTQPEKYLAPGALHHVFRQLPNGHYLTLQFEAQNTVLEDVILELDGDGEVVWEWHAADHIPDATIEHVHGNMALLGSDETAIYFNALLTRSFYKIDRESGEILWTFREDGDFTIETPHDWPWVSFAHSPQLLPDGHVLMYDNGGIEGHDFSRIVEYALDEESMTAELVWEYPGELADDHWYTQFWGDADRLANGNTLVTSGSVMPFDTPSRLFEVTADGAVVWQLEMSSPTEGGLAGNYSSERIPPLVEEL